MKNLELISNLNKLIEPIVTNLGYELYHIEFVKENGENYLRIYIDNENGISLEDCERVSRPVSNMLDVEDPIPDSYYLEVSSPGIFRTLYNDKHLKRYIGYKVNIKLNSLLNGKKKITAELKDFNDFEIIAEYENEDIKIARDKISSITLEGDF